MADQVGQQFGNYRLTRLLGSGGFADVYLGEHVYLKTQAAIKVLQMHMKPNEFQDFLSEAQTIAALKHPRIVRVLDFGVQGTLPFLVMDYAPLGTLRDRHSSGSVLPVTTVLPYVKQVADALQYAHNHQLVHRDIKPENMLVETTNDLLLSDFGIAIIAHKTQSLSTQEAIGTVTYMAPEQIKGKARPASDQYSLGIVVYEWLCGVCPFEGTTSIEVAMSHLTDPPPSLRAKVPSISAKVEQVVLKVLAKDPQQRFASVQAFAEALEQACRPAKSTARVASSPSQPPASALPPTVYVPSSPAASTLPPTQRASVSPPPGTVLCTYRGHSQEMRAVAWSPDGKRIASGSLDGTVQVWEASTGKTLLTYRGYTMAWSPDGKRIASAGDDKTVQVWEAATGKTLLTYRGHSDDRWGGVWAAAWSPDGKRIASSGDDGTVQVWDAVGGGHILTYRGHHGTPVNPVTWSPDGRHIASGSGDVQVWEASTGKLRLTYQDLGYSVAAAAWSPDGRYIASDAVDTESAPGYERTVQVWEAATGKTLLTYRGHSQEAEVLAVAWSSEVLAIAWSPDGKYIASGSQDKTVQVWQAVRIQPASVPAPTEYAQPSPPASALPPTVYAPSSLPASTLSPTEYAQSSPPASTLPPTQRASVSRPPGTVLCTYGGHSESVYAVAWSPDGVRIVSGSSDQAVQMWDATTGKTLLTYRGHSGLGVAWSPDGKYIASGSSDKTVQVWDAATGKPHLLKGNTPPGQLLLTYFSHTGSVNAVAWSPDGTRLASGSFDKTVQVWDAATGRTLFTYGGHADGVNAVAWSPDGRRIASGSDDKTIQVWQAP